MHFDKAHKILGKPLSAITSICRLRTLPSAGQETDLTVKVRYRKSSSGQRGLAIQ